MATKYKGKIVSAQGEGGPVYKFREVQPGEHPAVVYNVVLEGGGDIRNQDKTITENGQYTADAGYTGLGTVTVNVSGGGIPNYIAPKNNVNGVYRADNTATSFSLNGATDVEQYALYRAFFGCTNLTSADLSSLTMISGSYAINNCFYGCTGLTTVDLSSLATISGSYAMQNCFQGCTNLTSVDLSVLTTISSSSAMSGCFQGCANLISVDFPSLTTISGSSGMAVCFSGCINLTELRFPALQSFGTSTSTVSQFSNMLSGVTGCTLHFPSNMQSEVERRTGYPNFGGTNTVILFDLPPTA